VDKIVAICLLFDGRNQFESLSRLEFKTRLGMIM